MLLVSCSPAAETGINVAPIPTESPNIGAVVYAQECASCHGANLEGQADWQSSNEDGSLRSPPHDETGHTWHHPDSYILNRVLNGTADLSPDLQATSNMPAYKDKLTDAEIQAVIDFIKQSWPEEIQQMQAERTAQADQ